MRRLVLALAFAAGTLPAQAQMIPQERADIVVSFTNLQNALAEMMARDEKLQAENAALESRLATAMEWLKAAQQPK